MLQLFLSGFYRGLTIQCQVVVHHKERAMHWYSLQAISWGLQQLLAWPFNSLWLQPSPFCILPFCDGVHPGCCIETAASTFKAAEAGHPMLKPKSIRLLLIPHDAMQLSCGPWHANLATHWHKISTNCFSNATGPLHHYGLLQGCSMLPVTEPMGCGPGLMTEPTCL